MSYHPFPRRVIEKWKAKCASPLSNRPCRRGTINQSKPILLHLEFVPAHPSSVAGTGGRSLVSRLASASRLLKMTNRKGRLPEERVVDGEKGGLSKETGRLPTKAMTKGRVVACAGFEIINTRLK